MKPVVIAVVNDLHCGSTLGLAPPTVALDNGGEYVASKPQRWLWQCWYEYWDRVEAKQRELKADLYVIINGDAVEGDHHNTSEIISRNPGAQMAALYAALAPIKALKPSRWFIVRGTEAHVGHAACAEEGIAKGLLHDGLPVEGDPERGTASWWHLVMDVHSTRIDVTHHGRTGGRAHTRASAASLHAHDILLNHVKDGDRPPDLCLRAHFHKFNDSGDACPVRVVTGGAWQLKTGHVYKVAADSLADIGGLIVTITPDECHVTKVHFKAARGPVWSAA